jgi:hypothetical protein
MNETEDRRIQELREIFRRREGDVAAGGPPPPFVRRRARRRQIGTVAVAAMVSVALVAGSVVGLRALGVTDEAQPAGPGPTTTTTVSGITITYPEAWFAADPGAVGVEPADGERTLPSLVLSLTRDDPTIEGVLGCPAMAAVPPGQLLMTVQETPLALSGEAARPWPVELEPWGVDAGASGCYGGWTFLRAVWTAAGRSFDARVGFDGDASEADRDAMSTAFASMSFNSHSVATGESVTLGSGTAFDSTTWSLTASREADGICWTLETESTGGGSCWNGAPALPTLLVQRVTGEGAIATVMMPSDVEAVTVQTGGDVIGDIGLFPVPREWGNVDVAVIPLPGSGSGSIRFQDGSGEDLYPPQPIDWPTDGGESPASVDRQLPWENVDTRITAEGRFAGTSWSVEILFYRTGIRLTIGDQSEVVGPLALNEPLVRPLDADGFDALVLVLTDLSVDRVAISTEGVWDGRWVPASTPTGDEARLWVIEMPGAGSGTLKLDGLPSGDVSWP